MTRSAKSVQTVAVIDCGASEVRAYIADLGGEPGRKILDNLHFQVALTQTLRQPHLDNTTMNEVVEAFSQLRDSLDSYGITKFRAVTGSALREVSNLDVLLERIASATGIELEVITGAEEARLYYEALEWLLRIEGQSNKGRSLLVDIGSGNAVISLVRSGKLEYSLDEHIGHARIADGFRRLVKDREYLIAVDRYMHGAVEVLWKRLPVRRVNKLYITGSMIRYLRHILASDQKGLIAEISIKDIDAWYQELVSLPLDERLQRLGITANFARELWPAVAMMRNLATVIGLESVLIPQLRLRDGLLADFMPGALGPHYLARDNLLTEARALQARYGMDKVYGKNTGDLAVQLFNELEHLHGLGDRERVLLEFAAYIHDIGSAVNVRSRHKHSAYIIANTDIPGITDLEKRMVALVARYHRGAGPKKSHSDFARLDRSNRVVVSKLASLLRIAYALDVDRRQSIKTIRCKVENERMLIYTDTLQVILERWSMRSKADLFEREFGLRVVLVPKEV